MSLVTNPPTLVVPVVLATAAGYALATVGMKSAASGQVPLGILVAILGFTLAIVAEIILMRRFDVSVVYVSIIAAETVMVLLWAQYIGEGLGPRQLMGAALVVGGIALVAH